MPVADLCRKAGISQATYCTWKKKYAGLLPAEMKRRKQLEEDNSRLKKILADLPLDREMLPEVIPRTEGPRSESSEVWSVARPCSRNVQRLGSLDPAGLWNHRI